MNTKVKKKLGDVGDKFHNVNASDHPAPRTPENDSCKVHEQHENKTKIAPLSAHTPGVRSEFLGET